MEGRIEVQRDGVKIGWNLTAIIASVGLALYVSSVVSPLNDKLDKVEQAQIKLENRVEVLSEKLQHTSNSFEIHSREDEHNKQYTDREIELINDGIVKLKRRYTDDEK